MKLSSLLLASCLIVCTFQVSRGAEPWDGPAFSLDAKSLAAAVAKLPPPDDYSFDILLNETRLSFDDERCCTTTYHLIFRVLDEPAARNSSVVETSWAPWHQERPVLKARVVSSDGSEHMLDPKNVVEVPVDQTQDVLTDRRRLRAPLAGVRSGSIVEREIVIRDMRPFFAEGISSRVELDGFLPQRQARVTIEAPAKLPLRYETRGIKLEPRREESAGRVRLVFETGATPPRKPIEPLQARETPRIAHLAFSTGVSWSELAKGYHAVVEKQLQGADVKPLIADLLKEPRPREETAARLAARMHDLVQYTGLIFGDAAIVPRPPSETLARRFGDCKDQSALLVAMLRAAGLDAHVALLHSGAVEEIPTDLPGLNAFNHAIVHVAGEPPLWIDPTAPLVRVGELPLADQGKPALVASASSQGLVRTPAARSSDNRYQETHEFDMREPSAARVKYWQESRGIFEHAHRATIAQQTAKALRKEWDDYFAQSYPGSTVERLVFPEVRSLDKTWRLEAEGKGANFGDLSEGTVSVAVQPYDLYHKLPPFLIHYDPAAPAKPARQTDVVLIENYVCELNYRCLPPEGYKPGTLPENKELKVGPLTLSRVFETRPDNSLEARFRLDTGDGRFSPAEAEALPKTLAELGSGGTGPWHFTLSFELAPLRLSSEGKHREAFAAFQELLRKSPDAAALHSQYATALLRAGLGEAARAEARRATELDPRSVAAWHQLGLILTHDVLGRHFQPGMDWEGAAEAYRRGLALEPNSEALAGNYAILLDRDHRGVRWSSGARPDEALKEYARLMALYPRNELLRQNYLLNLLDSGKLAELDRAAADAPATIGMLGLRVAATAEQKGLEAARQRAAELAAEPQALRQLLLVSGDYLFRRRQYALAPPLWEGAAAGPGEAQVRRLAADVAKSKRHEEHWLAADQPAHPVQRVYAAIHLEGRELAEATTWFAPAAEEGAARDAVEALEQKLLPLLRQMRRPEIVPARRADALARLTFKTDGDDAVAHRVVAQYAGLPPRTWFVVKHEGKYKIWNVGEGGAELGAAALRALGEGREDAARQYLAWAYDDLRGAVQFFNPFGGAPFARLWGLVDAKNADDLKLAAAALSVEGSAHAEASRILLAARDAQTSDIRKMQIDRAVMGAGMKGKRFEQTRDAADRILKSSPRAQEAVDFKCRSFVLAGVPEDALAFVRGLAKEAPEDALLKLMIASMSSAAGEYVEAEKLMRPFATGRATHYVLNDLAWNALFLDPVPDTALADAKAAAELDPGPACLHTLACVYAVEGKNREAQETLIRLVDERGNRHETIDNYARGRLAENYGLPDVARALYESVELGVENQKSSTWHLAQRRLAALRPKP